MNFGGKTALEKKNFVLDTETSMVKEKVYLERWLDGGSQFTLVAKVRPEFGTSNLTEKLSRFADRSTTNPGHSVLFMLFTYYFVRMAV